MIPAFSRPGPDPGPRREVGQEAPDPVRDGANAPKAAPELESAYGSPGKCARLEASMSRDTAVALSGGGFEGRSEPIWGSVSPEKGRRPRRPRPRCTRVDQMPEENTIWKKDRACTKSIFPQWTERTNLDWCWRTARHLCSLRLPIIHQARKKKKLPQLNCAKLPLRWLGVWRF